MVKPQNTTAQQIQVSMWHYSQAYIAACDSEELLKHSVYVQFSARCLSASPDKVLLHSSSLHNVHENAKGQENMSLTLSSHHYLRH